MLVRLLCSCDDSKAELVLTSSAAARVAQQLLSSQDFDPEGCAKVCMFLGTRMFNASPTCILVLWCHGVHRADAMATCGAMEFGIAGAGGVFAGGKSARMFTVSAEECCPSNSLPVRPELAPASGGAEMHYVYGL